MQLPIFLYGQSVLRKETEDIDDKYPDLTDLLKNMFETLEKADGVGLAAPQVGLSIRLFIIDLRPLSEDDERFKDYTKIFINPEITEYSDEKISMEEGCLSIPGVHENVVRSNRIRIHYLDEQFVEHDEYFEDYPARVIQHEYDHLEAKIFTDRISPIRKQLIKAKMTGIQKGRITCSYKTKIQR